MPTANDNNTTPTPPSRRGILGGLAAVLAGSAIAGATGAVPTVPGGPDAVLLKACAEFDAIERQIKAAWDASPGSIETQDAIAPLYDRQEPLKDLISETPAQTIAGIRAKAHSLALLAPDLVSEPDACWEGDVIASILSDLTGIERPKVVERQATMAEQIAMDAWENPDAAMIGLCDAHAALTAASEAEDEVEGPAWCAYTRSHDAICESKPVTIFGILAKARAAKMEVQNPAGGEYDYESTPASGWAWQIVNHLLDIEGKLA